MSSKSVEELLAILKESEDQTEKLPTEIELFIKDYELVPSEEQVRSAYIYWTYLKWKELGHGTKEVFTRNKFFKRFSKFFKTGRRGKYRYYYVNGENIRISRLEHLELLKDLKLERQKRQWRKRSAKKGT